MQSIQSLQNIEASLTENLAQANSSVKFGGNELDEKIKKITSKISSSFKVDYSVEMKFRAGEEKRLKEIYINYLLGKKDDFNSHYIRLLAWHLQDLKVMNKKNSMLSIFEYQPFALAPFTVIEKTFRLFSRNRIEPNKAAFPLVMNYLNNYKSASKRYKFNLYRYLRSIKFAGDLDVYFVGIENIISWVQLVGIEKKLPWVQQRTVEKVGIRADFSERLMSLAIPQRTLDTVYFSDAWFYWMMYYSDLSNEKILKKLNCSFFKICSENNQKIILAKIIYLEWMVEKLEKLEEICINYIFPLTKSNPFKKEFWTFDCDENYKKYLDSAWNFIEQDFVKSQNSDIRKMLITAEKNK